MTTSATGTSGVSSQPTTSVVNQAPSAQLDKNAFLKLLVAQLQYQDPSNPTDSSQFMGQMAQFSALEQMTNVAQAIDALGSTESVSQGVALIGHQLTFTRADGSTGTGVAGSLSIQGGQITLDVGGEQVTPGSVVSVGALVTSSSAGTTGTTGSTGTADTSGSAVTTTQEATTP